MLLQYTLKMAPKKRTDALPTAIAKMKELMGDNPTEDSLKSMDPKTRNAGFSAFNTFLKSRHPESHATYKTFKTDSERRQWLLKFTIEGDMNFVTNETIKSTETASSTEFVWLTIEELGSSTWMNSTTNAAIAITAMESQKHENPALAEAGVKQYKHWIKKKVETDKEVDQVRIGSKANLSQEQLNVARGLLQDAKPSDEGPTEAETKRRKTTPPITVEPESGEDQAKRLAAANAAAAKKECDTKINAAKSVYQKMHKELAQVKMVEKTLLTKSWGENAVTYLRAATALQATAADNLMAEVFVAVTSLDAASAKGSANIAEIQEIGEKIKEQGKNAEESYKKYVANDLGQFSKLK